jgi:hypothetical protein
VVKPDQTVHTEQEGLRKVIFPNEKLIFVPIMKTGTVSITTFLRQFMKEEYKSDTDHNHPTLLQCHQNIIDNNDDPTLYKSFSFVRNPWSHMYSCYKYAHKTKKYKGSWKDWMWNIKFAYKDTNLYKTHDFSGFLDRLSSPYKGIDYVGKLETIDVSFQKIKDLYLNTHIKNHISKFNSNIPIMFKIPLPHLNVSSDSKNEYMTQYNPEQYETVLNLYKKDIDFFNFTFS